jgi:hypothetical protein
MTCTSLLLCDGSVISPSLAFNSQSNLGLYKLGTNQLGISIGPNGLGAEFGNFSTTNMVPNPYGPNTVRYTHSVTTLPLAGDVESSAIYMKMNHSISQMVYGIYGEIDAAQGETGGSFTKVNHLGAGDAHYVGHFGKGGLGYESASWADNTTGFLADVQVPGLSNAIMFNALWEQPTIPNYGMFVATAVPANALTISKYDLAHEGNVQIRITEPNYGVDRFEVFNNGQVNQIGPASTVTTTLNNAPEHRLVATYWNGSASAQQHAVIGHAIDNSGPSSHMYIKIGPYAAEQTVCLLSPGTVDLQASKIIGSGGLIMNVGGANIDMQGGVVLNCNSIQSSSAMTFAANGTVVAQFSYDSVDSTGAVAFNIPTTNVASAGATTTALPSNPLGFMVMMINGSFVKVPYYAV